MQYDNPEGPVAVTATEHLWIEMPDGIRLAARIWLPNGANHSPVPAILEYIPYRKADMVRARDERNHPYFASHGYACLRVDMRGSGDSEGHMPDMFSAHELSDARHVIEWIANQPWCSGDVGMFGTSWGGTASLQANVDAPDALKAIIAVCATHDRYEDDIHHMGGCLLTDTFEWGATLPAILSAPPTENVGDDWMERWIDRLENLSFPVEHWVREEARGTYWRHGSVIHQADRLSRPVLAIGGWSDRYSNSVMSLVSARPDLVWGIVGPWGHHYPDQGHPGPAMGFQQVALEWWGRWLKPNPTLLNWSRLRVWLREFDPPADAIDVRNGQWIETGPASPATTIELRLTDIGLLETDAPKNVDRVIPNDLRIGQTSGDTGYFGRYGGLPLDQAADDALSLTFETGPLESDLVIYGVPIAELDIRSGAPRSQVSLRINDVAPDNSSCRVGFCIRNLALGDQLDEPETTMREGEARSAILFPNVAYRFHKGHRIRLSMSASYWPMIWPTPSDGEVTLISGVLRLPVLESPVKAITTPLPSAIDLPLHKTHTVLHAPPLERFQSEKQDERILNGWEQPFAETFCSETETAFGYRTRAEHRVKLGDPLSAISEFEHHARYTRPGGVADIESSLLVTGNANAWSLEGDLQILWNGETILGRNWKETVPRKFG